MALSYGVHAKDTNAAQPLLPISSSQSAAYQSTQQLADDTDPVIQLPKNQCCARCYDSTMDGVYFLVNEFVCLPTILLVLQRLFWVHGALAHKMTPPDRLCNFGQLSAVS